METRRTPGASSVLSSATSYTLELDVRRAAWRWFRAWIANLVRKRIAERNARRAILELQAMSDRQLCDIGLHCTDIQRIAGHGPFRFPRATELRSVSEGDVLR
jgi:uncharacterized protein YjiS (DUF1127 family)